MTRSILAAGTAAILAVAGTASAAPPSGPLAITGKLLVERRVAAADGTTRIALAPPSRVVPGDRVVFVLAYRNTGAAPLSNVVLANPVPAGLAFRGARAGFQPPEVSADGRAFVPAARAAGLAVRSVRWPLARPLAPGAAGQVAFEAVVQ